jgi:hypothetical protein
VVVGAGVVVDDRVGVDDPVGVVVGVVVDVPPSTPWES